MHAHADMVHRQSPSSNPAHTVAAKPRDPDSILPSRRVSSLTGFSAEYEETLPINLDTQADSFPLSWPPARPDSAYGDAQISAGAQVRDLDAWYRSFVTVSPYVEDSSTETLAAPAQHPRRTSTRGGAAVTPSDTHEVPADMLMQVMMDLDVCKQLLADIAALDTTRAPKEHVACLQHLKVCLLLLTVMNSLNSVNCRSSNGASTGLGSRVDALGHCIVVLSLDTHTAGISLCYKKCMPSLWTWDSFRTHLCSPIYHFGSVTACTCGQALRTVIIEPVLLHSTSSFCRCFHVCAWQVSIPCGTQACEIGDERPQKMLFRWPWNLHSNPGSLQQHL